MSDKLSFEKGLPIESKFKAEVLYEMGWDIDDIKDTIDRELRP